MNVKSTPVSVLAWAAAALLTCGQSSQVRGEVIADSKAEFSSVQGQNGWYSGYRNVTMDGKAIDYDPNADFIPFEEHMWMGTAWDLDLGAGGAPWTTIAQEAVHPNGVNNGEEHWAIRRWTASELSGPTMLGVTWHVRKENTGGGNGVTGALHVNGVRVQSATIPTTDNVGVTNTVYLSAKPTDILDLIHSPIGVDGASADGSDGSFTWMRVETLADTDSDGLADAWENLYFPGDLTKLTANGDFDGDGLRDSVEMQKGTSPNKADTDEDGLADGVETNTRTYVSASNTGTDPLAPDTDADGRKDGDEINVNPKTDPFIPDTDNDTYLDGDEVATGHDPNNFDDNPEATAIANSRAEFSGVQGQEGWYHGYRNYTADGGGDNYDPNTGFIAFKGGADQGDWDGDSQQWTGSQWDLNTAAAGPWTELGSENTHPNSGTVHWTIRRWVADELSQVTPLAIRWHTRKSNTGGGNGVTGGLYINGQLVDKAWVRGTDGVGVTRTFFANVAPGDKIDLILSPRGADGADSDGYDGSVNRLLIDPTMPAEPRQPDGTLFIPAGAGDSDADGIPDAWEKLYFANDLTKLSANGDNDKDGLTDLKEYERDSDPTKPDTDGDGLNDLVETATGKYVSTTDTGSSPKKADSDGDGLSDAAEVQRVPPTDPNKVDSDSDGFSDQAEIQAGTDPLVAASNPTALVIADSQKEFSGVQGANGWYNGYVQFDPSKETLDYDPATDFVPFPGGQNQGDWDGTSQVWTGSAWDLNTEAAGPWTWMTSLDVHPNGTNSPPSDFEHWATRRWVANELTNTTTVALWWFAKKNDANNQGVTGQLHVNGKRVDFQTLAGTNTVGQERRFYANLKPGDIVDLALTPEGIDKDRHDWSDASATWLRIDLRIPPNPVQPDGTPFNAGGQIKVAGRYDRAQNQFTVTWPSQAGAKYTLWGSSDLKTWTSVKTGIDSGGTETSTMDIPAAPQPAFKFYKISQP